MKIHEWGHDAVDVHQFADPMLAQEKKMTNFGYDCGCEILMIIVKSRSDVMMYHEQCRDGVDIH